MSSIWSRGLCSEFQQKRKLISPNCRNFLGKALDHNMRDTMTGYADALFQMCILKQENIL